MPDRNPTVRVIYNIGLVLLPLAVIIISLMAGSYKIDPASVFEMIFKGLTGGKSEESDVTQNLFWTIRLPRVLCAALAGAGLALSGAVFQSIFKNPLASPYTLGVSNGAGFGAAMGIVLSLGTIGIQFSSALFGLISIGVTFLLAARSRSSTASLILAGMLVSALFSSLISLLKLLADPFEKLPQIVFWLMGSLSTSTMAKFFYILPVCGMCFLIIILFRWKINVMSMGDRDIAMEKLRFLNIDFLAEKSYTQISGGERQMVMIAASLAQEPDLIILDEPVSHLDFGNQYRFVSLMKQLQEAGTGVIMTTHFPDHVLQLGCRTLVLSGGVVAADGKAADVITSDSMSELYGINADVTEIHGRVMCVPYG